MIEYKLEHIFSYNVTVTTPEVIGTVHNGIRLIFYLTGGTVNGPKLSGRIRPVGADWLIVRSDGIGTVDVRATIETDDEALIYVTYGGVLDLGENGYQNILEGKMPPSGTAIRTAPRFETAHPNYRWLNRLQCVGIGQAFVERNEVMYDVYGVL